MGRKNDFTKGSVPKTILSLALPMTLAQLINILYNIVDRMYIGRIPNASTLALTGIGVTFPIITIIMAFANLFGMGGAPLCSIARGRGDNEEAEKIMGNSFALLIISGILLTALGLIFKKPLLFLFGASDATFSYANDYISIYLLGTIFVMISLGMNSFINSQGFGRIGMMTILLGAITNIVLDPIFIFVFHMEVKGAAFATIISQFLSSIWVLKFLIGKNTILKLKFKNFKIKLSILKKIISLGLSSFIMALTNSTVQIICNITLQSYGGDLYVGIMTVINSIREIIMMPVSGITNGSQPVLGFNYGAKEYKRVRSGIKFMSIVCIVYTTLIWLVLRMFPEFFIRIFNSEPELIQKGVPSMNIYFFGFFAMSLQFSGQSTYVALGKSKQAVFFSLLRKIIIVVPLTLILPRMYNLGTTGVFLAEPISNFLGGAACYITMLFTVWPSLKEKQSNCVDV
ncbi:MATE family efflux transporter [Clostridium faecium]|uniref:MATE family efflux transporter n=1 Tax=Clostridium butanoliproducens TaxID=2991837 RepID=UPI0024BAC6CE|nr:MATE family efflux transporter [Clostridium butanoliproducens]